VTETTNLPKAILDEVFPSIEKRIERVEDKIVEKFQE